MPPENTTSMNKLLKDIRACTHCAQAVPPMAVEPNPVLQVSARSKIRIIGQAPGNLAYQSSRPFTDPSGERLRDWLGVNEATFYDANNFAVTPMGFCFPGNDKNGGDLPPRKECAPLWQDALTQQMPDIELTLLVGLYAQKAVLGKSARRNLTETVRHWQDYAPLIIPLPHPSWRNNVWIKKNPWFEDIVSELKERVAGIVAPRT
jgi:uracil-DNA glycosylase